MATVDQFKEKAGAVAEKKPIGFPEMLKSFLPEIQRALPRHLSGDRMARIALSAFRKNPKLAQCDPRSVFACVIQASQLGLEPDTMGRSYLIPYGNECTFVPGWKGLVDLMNRSGAGTVYTGIIFKDQKYTFVDGSKRELIIHNETELDDPEDITHAYAIGWVKGAEMPVIELWRIAKIHKHLVRYNKVGKRHYAFDNMEMYARKVPLLQVLKYMPCSAELVAAMGLNDAAEIGEQALSVKDAVDGSWTPSQNDDPQDVKFKETAAPATATQAKEDNAPIDLPQSGVSNAEHTRNLNKARPKITLDMLKARFNEATDIDILKAEFSLIAELPDAVDQEVANECYIENLDRLGRK